MRRSKAEIYFHLVWGTKNRLPLLTPHVERDIYRCIENEARRLGCVVLALNGVEDHVHMVVKAPTQVSAAQIAHQVKGVSSHFARDTFPACEAFTWQEGYAVFSLSRPHKDVVIAYVRNQKKHHAEGSVWSEWEETDEEAADPTTPRAIPPPGGRLAEGSPDG
jgi:putative transposase